MRVWIVTVIVLFLLVQLYHWIQGIIVPLPLYVIGGAFLAIASNYEKGLGALLHAASFSQTPLSQEAKLVESDNRLEPAKTVSSQS